MKRGSSCKIYATLGNQKRKIQKMNGSSGRHELIWCSDKRKKHNIFQDLEELTNKFPEILKIFAMLLDISFDNPRGQTHRRFKVCCPHNFQLPVLMCPHIWYLPSSVVSLQKGTVNPLWPFYSSASVTDPPESVPNKGPSAPCLWRQ